MTTPAPDGELGMERDELLRQSLLQLIAYHASQVKTSEVMRDQLIYLAHAFGAEPKLIARAADLTSARMYQVIKREREGGNVEALATRLGPRRRE